MSQSTLLKGIHKYLQTVTGDIQDLKMGVMADAKPDPKMGRWYLSIFPISSSPRVSRNAASKIEEEFTVGCTLTTKFIVGKDRQGAAITLADTGITDTAERFRDWIHGSYSVINTATTLLASTVQPNGPFCEPLLWKGTQYGTKGDDWVYSSGNSTIPIIYVAEMTFSGGFRARAKDPN